MFSAGENMIVPPTTLSLSRTLLQRHGRIPGGGRCAVMGARYRKRPGQPTGPAVEFARSAAARIAAAGSDRETQNPRHMGGGFLVP